MHAPERISARNLGDYLDVLTRAVFQSGISWRVVEAKWPGTREALRNFDPEQLADLSPEDIDRLAADSLGGTGAYYFPHVAGEPVPPHEEWMAAHQPPASSRSTTTVRSTPRRR